MSGSVAGLGSAHSARVSTGTRGTTASGTYTITAVRNGTLDVIATRRTGTPPAAIIPDRIVIRRALDPWNGEVRPAIDFNAAEAHDILTTTLTVAGLQNGESGSMTTSLLSANQSFHSLGTRFTLAASQPMHSAPASILVARDYHAVNFDASDACDLRGRFVSRYYHAPSNQSLFLGAALAQPSVTSAASSPNLRLRLTLASQTDYSSQVELQISQSGRFANASAVASHFGGTPATWIVEVPDLSNVPGWQSTWGLQAGAAIDMFISAVEPTPARVAGVPVDGSTHRTAWLYGKMATEEHPSATVRR